MLRNVRQRNHPAFKVLVVDDDPTMLNLSLSWLEAAGFDVITGSGGQEGLSLLRSERPNLLVTDLNIREMDGLEFCRRARADSGLPVLVFSTTTVEEGREKSIQAGASEYIEKDLDLTDLIEAVREFAIRSDEGD